jgi:phosphoglucosamine mutase
MSDYATTGDGLVAALQVLAVVQKLDQPVSKVCHRFEALPQIMKNVRYKSGKPLEDAKVRSAITAAEKKLNGAEPTGSDPVVASGGSVTVDHSLTLKAKAWASPFLPPRFF